MDMDRYAKKEYQREYRREIASEMFYIRRGMFEPIERMKKDPDCKDDGVAVALSAVYASVNLLFKVLKSYDKQINKLEERIVELEKQIPRE